VIAASGSDGKGVLGYLWELSLKCAVFAFVVKVENKQVSGYPSAENGEGFNVLIGEPPV
jgi:hypothetical protein